VNEDQESAVLREYIKELKTVRLEVLQIIRKQNDEVTFKAATYYPQKVNQLLKQMKKLLYLN
jgi:hypothetical protein